MKPEIQDRVAAIMARVKAKGFHVPRNRNVPASQECLSTGVNRSEGAEIVQDTLPETRATGSADVKFKNITSG